MKTKRKYSVHIKRSAGWKSAVAIALVLFAINISAQNPKRVHPTEVMILADSDIGKIDLQFKNDEEVGNLSVIITDNAGQTVFVENISRFKGLYKKTIDLKENGKGTYNLWIIKDEEKISKQINIQ